MSFCVWLISLSIMFSRFIYVAVCIRLSFLLRLNNILLYRYTASCLSIHLLMDTWLASTLWLLWILFMGTWVYRYPLKFLLSILLSIYPEVELLDLEIILCLIFWGITIPFSTVAASFHISTPPFYSWWTFGGCF